jgi:hypothetical protein
MQTPLEAHAETAASDVPAVVVDDVGNVAPEGDAIASGGTISFGKDPTAGISTDEVFGANSTSDYGMALNMASSTNDAVVPGYDVHGNAAEQTAVTTHAGQDNALPHTDSADALHALTTTAVPDTTKDLALHTHDALL